MSHDDKDEPQFKVTDRRTITEQGEIISDKDEKEVHQRPPADQQARRPAPGTEQPPLNRPSGQAAKMDFSSFLLSLATTALVHLGEVPDPAGGESQENIAAARQMVDILAMLEEKTEGNRSAEENRLVEELLYDLRMKIMAKTNVIKF